MLRLSKMTDYAVVVLTQLAREPGRIEAADAVAVQTAPALAAACGVGEPTVAKVLKLLAQAGIVHSQRGARGGYALARPLAAIAIADVIAAVDGPIALTACVDGAAGGCEVEALCPVRGRWDPVNEAISAALGAITLADMERAAAESFGLPRRSVRASAMAAPPAE